MSYGQSIFMVEGFFIEIEALWAMEKMVLNNHTSHHIPIQAFSDLWWKGVDSANNQIDN